MKKYYIAETINHEGVVIGSVITTIWYWQPPKQAYNQMTDFSDRVIINFRRVK